MNTRHRAATLTIAFFPICLASVLVLATCWQSASQDAVAPESRPSLRFWDEEFPVVFEDRTLKETTKQAVVSDLQAMYGRPMHMLYRPHRPEQVIINGKPLPIDGAFQPYGGLTIWRVSFRSCVWRS